MIITERDFMLHKESIIKELAKLERLGWSDNPKVAESIFPYTIVEAISLLLNARMDGSSYKNFTKTSEETEKTLSNILGD